MLFAFIHELGHMVVGIFLKLKPKSLSIMPFGISITFETYGYKKLIEIKKMIIAIAGPAVNIVIAGIVSFMQIDNDLKETIIYSNILIAIFNLIPLYPLDGGRILKVLIRFNNSKMKTDSIINKVSNSIIIFLTALASIVILYLKNFSILFILVYLWIIVVKENKKYNISKKIYDAIQKNSKCIDN